MTAPSQTPEAAGLEDAGHIVCWKAGGVNYYPKGENFTVSASCRVEPLVTAASAQAAIDAWVRWTDKVLREEQAETLKAITDREAAEARADRLAKALDGLDDVLTEAESRADERWERESPNHSYRPGLLAEVNAVKQACAIARAALQQETQP